MVISVRSKQVLVSGQEGYMTKLAEDGFIRLREIQLVNKHLLMVNGTTIG